MPLNLVLDLPKFFQLPWRNGRLPINPDMIGWFGSDDGSCRFGSVDDKKVHGGRERIADLSANGVRKTGVVLVEAGTWRCCVGKFG